MKIYRPKLIDVQTIYGESLLKYDTDAVMHELSDRQYRRTVFEDLQAVRSRPWDAPMATYNKTKIEEVIDEVKELFRRFK